MGFLKRDLASTWRILGSGGFVERVNAEAEAKERKALRLRQKVPDLSALSREVAEGEGTDGGGENERGSNSDKAFLLPLSGAWCRRMGQLAVRKFGHTGASVARFLGVTTSLINRYAAPGELL
jgi:hypothetical protein